MVREYAIKSRRNIRQMVYKSRQTSVEILDRKPLRIQLCELLPRNFKHNLNETTSHQWFAFSLLPVVEVISNEVVIIYIEE